MDERIPIVEQLHRRHAGVLYDKCVRILGDRAEAEDAVQETFVAAFRALPAFREQGDGHLPWLYRIATNACLKILRTRQRKGADPLGDQDPAAPFADVEDAMHTRRVLAALAQESDDRTMEIVVAHYVDGLDQGEIARHLGISRRAVVKRLTALRAKAEQLLGGAAR